MCVVWHHVDVFRASGLLIDYGIMHFLQEVVFSVVDVHGGCTFGSRSRAFISRVCDE